MTLMVYGHVTKEMVVCYLC